jgi:hypothetical protein
MDGMGIGLIAFLLGGLVLRMIDKRDKGRRLGPGSPAHFLYFTGRQLAAAKRVHAYSEE